MSDSVVIAEMRVHQQATYSTLENLTNSLYSGQITVQQWQLAVASELKDAHLAQAIYAVGGKLNMTQANYGRVGGVLRDEYRYLTNFAQQIANGQISQAEAISRIRQYGNATQQSYWREFVEASTGELDWVLGVADHCHPSAGKYGCVELAMGSPYTVDTIPTYPGAGETTCHGNCNCTVERR